MKSLNNRKVLVTGASRGIGMFTALHLAGEGAVPVLAARDGRRLELISRFIEESYGIKPYIHTGDLGREADRKKLIEYVKENHKDLSGLINNAGFGSFEQLQSEPWSKSDMMIRLNVTALIHITKELLPLLKSNDGHIVNVASQSGKIATPKAAVYTATKHAVVGFTNSLRMEVDGVSVTGVNPGPVDTSFFDRADPTGGYRISVGKIMLNPNIIAAKMVHTFISYRREINAPVWMEGASKLYQLMPSTIEKVFSAQFHKK
ncbi:SDR family NAD(P)-dependent oxidoreductase [Salimicrobium humidisoli]|uniref:Oxidoreductase n=1 Tax=Salimicrobium humidisoli TaxID=2029857 RepID=A0ABX4HQP1_9BACI|nr:SDR family oxidoreductase [Salimicrobium humidisoli]PBB05509.1 oxidoreductase [Salimicrobium humidisoli]